MKRVHYFNGQLLTAADFQAEQDFHLEKHRRQNLRMHRVGVVSGLDVSIGDGNTLTISPGLAIDSRGNEILVMATQVVDLPEHARTASVLISYRETLTDPVRVLEQTAFSRIEESFVMACVPEGGVNEDSVTLACLRRSDGQWHLARRSRAPYLVLAMVGLVFAAIWCSGRGPR